MTGMALEQGGPLSPLNFMRMHLKHCIRQEFYRNEVVFTTPPIREWQAYGLTCYIVRGPVSINGYVAVPKEHPWYKVHYSECPLHCGDDWCQHRPERIIDVHGGITYSGLGEKGWIFGFDTAHYGDSVYYASIDFDTGGKVWVMSEIADETDKLAAQLSVIK